MSVKTFVETLVRGAIVSQRQAWNSGSENQGASIDVLAVARDLAAKLPKNKKAVELVEYVDQWDVEQGYGLRFAKPLDVHVVRGIESELKSYLKA
ncbi:lysis inhibition accessory protein [Aeromonas phage phiAS5]|uniref:Lysis inhibition accessory protein n=1 Tax=Aeromonas phage phiAS5 TaxID=879630 RepID=E1A2F4_9CAUD|nr:lysis inhibition; accessory protein [Aeromonas phage phiAS5]ADM79900.1 lysis inhibition accessory protein [Aeromonas phage phiAS5]BES53330.1 hypothetical protein [Aeromonas phage phiWae14]